MISNKPTSKVEHEEKQDSSEQEGVDEGESISSKQMKESFERIENEKNEGLKVLMNVRQENEHEENQRKINQETLMENLNNKLRIEEKKSTIKDAAIAMRWPLVLKENIPSEIQKQIELQERNCQKILKIKEGITDEFRQILRKQDQEYIGMLNKQSSELEQATKQINEMVSNLMKRLKEEYDLIENAFEKERKELIHKKERELNQLQEKRREKERNIIYKRIKFVEENENNLQQLIDKEVERYAHTKKINDKELHDLEKAIDHMTGVFELNSEKLKYYYKVTDERCKENEKMIISHKNKLAKLQEQLTIIKGKYLVDDKKFKFQNNELTVKYAKMVKQYKDLMKKFKYFRRCDGVKYKQLWKLNEEKIKELANKLLINDKFITERILNMQWEAPDQGITQTKNNFMEIATKGETKVTQKNLKKKILVHIVDKMGFLSEKKVNGILSKLKDGEKDLIKIESVLSSIGINSPREIDRLTQILMSKVENVESLGNPNENSQKILNWRLPQAVIVKALNTYVIERRTENQADENKKRVKLLNMRQLEKQRREREEKEYWKSFGRLIPKKKRKLWENLLNSQDDYYNKLLKRKKLISEIERIKEQNIELENLLNEYRNDKINDELYIKPGE